jgi:hypothetical protein
MNPAASTTPPAHAKRPPTNGGRGWAALFALLGLLAARAPADPIQPDSRSEIVRVEDRSATPTQLRIELTAPTAGAAPRQGGDGAELIPPLSIYESRLALVEAAATLQAITPETRAARMARAMTALAGVERYVNWIDRTHPTLPDYKFYEFGTAKLRDEGWTTFEIKPASPYKKITALGISAHHGDITVGQLVAIDASQARWEFNQTIQIHADQPRSEICYLPLPTELAEVRVRCRKTDRADPDRPRLFVNAGVSARPESAKQTVYYIQRARFHLRQEQVEEARRMIVTAAELLYEYQIDRGL